MSVWTALVIIAALIVFWGIYDSRRKERLARPPSHDNERAVAERERELKDEIAQLRERLQVLERIATDGSEATRIAAEIENLRDK